jgi:hypothetical protein
MPEIFEIPIDRETDDEPSLKMRTVLEDIELVLRFDWNTREERWSISIYDALDNPLIIGQVLTINNELLQRFEIIGLPPGELLLYDTSNKVIEAGLEDLGKRCRLLYLSVA